MDTDDGVVFASLLMMGALYFNFSTSVVAVTNDVCKRTRRVARQRRFWVNPLNTVKKRREQGDHFNLIREMRQFDESRFIGHLRMSPKSYDKLLRLVTPLITKETIRREPIDPGTRLEITLRYLATGEGSNSLANQFRVGRSTIPKIIDETLAAICKVLAKQVLPQPTQEDLRNTAEGFWVRWNFPNCIGAIDGKHIAIIAPPGCGSEYFNYKNYHSIILLAVCDYRYRLTMIDVGMPGRCSDSGVFRDTKIGRQFEKKWIDLPISSPIEEDGPKLPYYLVGDEGFGLKSYLQRPYPGKSKGTLPESKRIFNYRLSRARRVIENSFGILAAKWRIFRQPIHANVEKVKAITLAAVCLHNFLLIEESDLKSHQKSYLHPTMADRVENGVLVEGDWRKDPDPIHHNTFSDLQEVDGNDFEKPDSGLQERFITNAIAIRNELKEFFMMSGMVKWQFRTNLF